MELGEKMLVIENLIYQFASTQFQLNGIDPIQAHFVMECVCSKFQKTCLNTILMERVSIQETGNPSADTKHTGTPEELSETLKTTGFTPSGGGEKKIDNT